MPQTVAASIPRKEREEMSYCESLGFMTADNIRSAMPATPKLGDRVTVAPVDSVTRDCWGVSGVITRIEVRTNAWGNHRNPKTLTFNTFLVIFDQPVKRGPKTTTAGHLTGLFLPIDSLMG